MPPAQEEQGQPPTRFQPISIPVLAVLRLLRLLLGLDFQNFRYHPWVSDFQKILVVAVGEQDGDETLGAAEGEKEGEKACGEGKAWFQVVLETAVAEVV